MNNTNTRKKALFLFIGLATYRDIFAFTGTHLYCNSFAAKRCASANIGRLEASKDESFLSDNEQSVSFESAVRNGWKPDRGHFIGLRRKSPVTKRDMVGDGAVMPDGGLSPCIIKVVGVGGGGCNAVSCILLCFVTSRVYVFIFQ
jgi:hypothetical protein